MTDEEIVLYFNEHRLAKLESYLLKDGSSVEHELQNLLDRFYEQIVPEHERMEVEAQIELEREREAAQREASRRFAVVHFHEGDDRTLPRISRRPQENEGQSPLLLCKAQGGNENQGECRL